MYMTVGGGCVDCGQQVRLPLFFDNNVRNLNIFHIR